MPTDSLGKPGYLRERAVLASAAYTTDQTVALVNHANQGMHVILDVTDVTLAPTSITLTISGIDPVSGNAYTILAGAAVVGVSTNVYKVFPGATAAGNAVANDFIPLNFQISVVGAGVDADNYFTYSVGMVLI